MMINIKYDGINNRLIKGIKLIVLRRIAKTLEFWMFDFIVKCYRFIHDGFYIQKIYNLSKLLYSTFLYLIIFLHLSKLPKLLKFFLKINEKFN